MCMMPATKWYASAASNPQATSFARILLARASWTAAKPAADDSDLSNAQNAKTRPTNKITPVMRWTIDVKAGNGKWIVVISRLTGRLLFTALYTLSWLARCPNGSGPSGQWFEVGGSPLPRRTMTTSTCQSRGVDYRDMRPQ